MFSAIERVTFALLEPEVDDRVIHEASFEAVHAAFEVIEMLFDVAAEVTDILDGETVGASTAVPFCVTLMVLLSDPEVRLVNDTVTVPKRFDVLVFAAAFTVIVLPFADTVIQLASLVVVNVPSVLTVTFSEPPEAS